MTRKNLNDLIILPCLLALNLGLTGVISTMELEEKQPLGDRHGTVAKVSHLPIEFFLIDLILYAVDMGLRLFQ
jgi:hypothetical protein